MDEIPSFIPGDTEQPPDPGRRFATVGLILFPFGVSALLTGCESSDGTNSYHYAVIYRDKNGNAYVSSGTASLSNHDCPDPPEGHTWVSGTCTVSSGPIDMDHYREKHKGILNP
ncbi:hypothetical protein JW766_01375 [Candidatus Dojkabacteria bacterium]|nr:hypothetical protein [Candidatus Dojkabacteria bacterium]